jgi:hypothetical protein
MSKAWLKAIGYSVRWYHAAHSRFCVFDTPLREKTAKKMIMISAAEQACPAAQFGLNL